jgi:hypothetical protein
MMLHTHPTLIGEMLAMKVLGPHSTPTTLNGFVHQQHQMASAAAALVYIQLGRYMR